MKQYGPRLTTFAVAALVFGGVAGSALAAEPELPSAAASTTEVRAEPAALPGDNPHAAGRRCARGGVGGADQRGGLG